MLAMDFTINGEPLQLRLISSTFAKTDALKEGLGEIQLQFIVDLPRSGPNRRLTFENHHQSRIAAYLVNCLVPRDPEIRISAQHRNYEQSLYQLDYLQRDTHSSPLPSAWWVGPWGWRDTALLFLLAGIALLWRRRAATG